MKLQQKTTLQQNIEKIETANNTTLLAVSAAVSALNNSYKSFWNLPDAELLELLQYLFDNDKLQEVFVKHYNAATALNAILASAGYGGSLAIATAAREFEVTDGVISLVEAKLADQRRVLEVDGGVYKVTTLPPEPEDDELVIEDGV